ncbi:MAG: glycosyltransferase family 2 protein, partial [archaeon]|nr:glycosyltransferase family 2 protein [archaeon]
LVLGNISIIFKNMNTALITIILPTYNGVKWIEKAIQSVLAQSFINFEFIIINDGSIDNTEEIVLKFEQQDRRIKYFKNEHNLGVQRTRNLALNKAQGKYIAEIDQDDQWVDKDKLKKQVEFLENNKEYVLIGTGVVVIDGNGMEIARYLMPETDLEIRKKILRANCFIHSSVLYRTKLVKEMGGYNPVKMSEDHDLWLRLGRRGKFMNSQEYSVKYLFSTGGYNSQDKIVRLKQNLLFIKEHKDFYPNYLYALILGWIKICFYPLFSLMPTKIKGLFLKLHKKIWLRE